MNKWTYCVTIMAGNKVMIRVVTFSLTATGCVIVECNILKICCRGMHIKVKSTYLPEKRFTENLFVYYAF